MLLKDLNKMRYLKNFRIFEETQVFNFDKVKEYFFKYIDAVKNKEYYKTDFIYELITNQLPGSTWDEESKLLIGNGFMNLGEDVRKVTLKFSDSFHTIRKSQFFNCYYENGNLYPLPNKDDASGWSQKSYNPNKDAKQDKDYNYYITIAKDRANVNRFFNSFADLDKQMIKLSDQKKEPLAWKTYTANLSGFLRHNDSLKAYYYNENMKNDVEKILMDWCERNKIKIEPRTHTHGVDIGGKSFGQILSKSVEDALVKQIEKYGGTLTNQQYFDWFRQWLPYFLKTAKVTK